jgi:hypothetical protein
MRVNRRPVLKGLETTGSQPRCDDRDLNQDLLLWKCWPPW